MKSPTRWAAAAVAASFFLPAIPAQRPAHGAPPDLLSPVTTVPASLRAWDQNQRRTSRDIKGTAFVRVDTAALTDNPLGRVAASLDGQHVVIDFEPGGHQLEHAVFYGTVEGRQSSVLFTVSPTGVTYGSIQLGADEWAIVYTGERDVHSLQTLDNTLGIDCTPLDAGPQVQAGGAGAVAVGGSGGGGGDASLASTGNTIIDVCCFYTHRARDWAGGPPAIQSRIAGAVARATLTNLNSAVPMDFRMVYVGGLPYSENGSSSDLSRFRSTTDGIMDGVHATRTLYGGDLMHLITQPASLSYCGIAYLMNQLSANFRTSAFGVTVASCMNGNVVAHEMGHNIACSHDRQNAGTSLFPYGYGFRTADSRYRTVMAYTPGTRVDVWSSPNVTHNGYTMGARGTENNARSIRRTRQYVEQFAAMQMVPWCDHPGGIPGRYGEPTISGSGTKNGVVPIRVSTARYLENAPGALFIGASAANLPFLGGTLVPTPHIIVSITGSGPPIDFDASAMAGLPSGAELWFQSAFLDPNAANGVSMTDGLQAIVP